MLRFKEKKNEDSFFNIFNLFEILHRCKTHFTHYYNT